MKLVAKFIFLSLVCGLLNHAYANASAKGIHHPPNNIEWSFFDYRQGGFDSKIITLLVKKTLDGKAAISLHDEDFSIAIYDSEPKCNKLRGIENVIQNKCSLRIKVDGEIINLGTKDNWFAVHSSVGVGVGFLYYSVNKLDSKASAKFLLKASNLEFEIYDGDNFYVYQFHKNNLFK